MSNRVAPALAVAALIAWALAAAGSARAAGMGPGGQVRAPGEPILTPVAPDCPTAQAAYTKLSSGLHVQLEAIRKEQLRLEQATADSRNAWREVDRAVLEGLASELRSMATSSRVLRLRISRLKAADLPLAQRRAYLRLMGFLGNVEEAAENVDKLEKAYSAGAEFGEHLRTTSRQLSADLAEVERLLRQSGLAAELWSGRWSELGEAFAKYFAGPYGALAFRTLKLTIDVTVATEFAMANAVDSQVFANNLNILREEYDARVQRLEALEAFMAANCGPVTEEEDEPETSASSTPPEEPEGEKKMGAAQTAALTGALAGTGVATGLLLQQLQESAQDCGPSPGIPASCLSFRTRNTSTCRAAESEYRQWCSCHGGRFDVGTGACVR